MTHPYTGLSKPSSVFRTFAQNKYVSNIADGVMHLPGTPFHILNSVTFIIMLVILAILQIPSGPLGIPHTSAPTPAPTTLSPTTAAPT